MKFKVLDNEPIQFYNTDGTLMATLQVSGSGDLVIQADSGSSRNIILGDETSAADVEIGLPGVASSLTLMGGGTISSNGNILTIGSTTTSDIVRINNAQYSQSFDLTGSMTITGSLNATNIIGSAYSLTDLTVDGTSVTFSNLPTSEPTVTGSVWISGSSVAHPNSGYLMIFNP